MIVAVFVGGPLDGQQQQIRRTGAYQVPLPPREWGLMADPAEPVLTLLTGTYAMDVRIGPAAYRFVWRGPDRGPDRADASAYARAVNESGAVWVDLTPYVSSVTVSAGDAPATTARARLESWLDDTAWVNGPDAMRWTPDDDPDG